ncbi:pyridoxal phosphate-dependent aminotransferase [Staphylococcus saprophyticus]
MIEPRKHIHSIERPLEQKSDRLSYLRLDGNELVPSISDEFVNMLKSEINADLLTSYPELGKLYNLLSEYVGVNIENIVITPGSEIAIKQIFETFCYEGDEVVINHPTYGMFKGYCELLNLQDTLVDIEENLKIDIDKIIRTISNDTKIVAIANPNGNTGSYANDFELIKLLEFCKKRGVLVLLDQAYIEFMDTEMQVKDLINTYENLIIVRTFSKALGLAGLRIGFVICNYRLRRFIHSIKPVHEISSVSAKAAELLLTDYKLEIQSNIQSIIEGRNFLLKSFKKLNLKTFEGKGNFIQVWLNENKEKTIKKLKSNGILVKDNGDNGILKGSIRITSGPVKEMEKVVSVIKEVI